MNFYDFLEEQEPEKEIIFNFVNIKTSRFKTYLDGMLKLFR